MDIINEMYLTIIAPVALILIVPYLTTSLLNNQFKRELEEYRKNLEYRFYRFKTKYSMFHQKQAAVIGDFYGKLAKLDRKVGILLSPYRTEISNPTIELGFVTSNMGSTDEFFNEHRIYFSEDTQIQIEETLDALNGAIIDFEMAIVGKEYREMDKNN